MRCRPRARTRRTWSRCIENAWLDSIKDLEPQRKKKLKGRGVPSISTVKQQAKFDDEEYTLVSKNANGYQAIKYLRQARRCKQLADNFKALQTYVAGQ